MSWLSTIGRKKVLNWSFSNPIGASSVAKGDIGMSSKGESFSNWVDMDIDDDYESVDLTSIHNLGEAFLKDFCKEASVSFFNQYGLISHQINSYNDFIKNGIQRVFDSFDEIIVEPGYDPSKKGNAEWRYASIRFGKVTLI
ncbi:putative DNA-directed RNA polymerase [Rosa chinensis]|uniref:Putative DNA-directed RNA polymerase n=1 Tax=Rosa chinensis TaxID=74649 RepID=A0A2P6QD25_ROSCH|nr:putative DNA-directed RNA polymerase [Rosa chinensis]